jgi:mannose-6-phosphate isomerase-like protein (cupin superfamily)
MPSSIEPSPSSTPANPKAGEAIASPAVHYGEHRPWGNYIVLGDAEHYKCKQLQVYPGQRLSLQLHHHREEHWIITQGEGLLQLGEVQRPVQAGDHIHIPVETRHRLENTGQHVLELIEVQLGASFDESDIVRFDDDYQRC